jgi:DNA-binding transcriptional regulator YbjK
LTARSDGSIASVRERARPIAARDPEGRRRALLAATVEVIAEVGVGKTTHRAIAARAGVPLGATTYYFPTLHDLVTAALEQVTDGARVELGSWARELGDGRDLAGVLPRLVQQYLADRPRALLEYELYLAAARSPELRPLAEQWLHGMRDLLTPYTGAATAMAIIALLDGAMLQAVVTGDAPDSKTLRTAITRLLA